MKKTTDSSQSNPAAITLSTEPPITDGATLAALCTELGGEEIIAFDTEFIREKTYYPEIALIQVANANKTWLVDPLALSKEQMAPLLDLLQNPKILKVLHAAQGDQECLFMSYGITATPTFDTAQGAALLGFGDNVGLAKILKETLGINIEKGHARTDWKARPLQKELLKYAHGDVAYLVPAGRILLEKLESKQRKEWALELSQRWENHKAFEYDAMGVALKHARSGRLDPRSCLAYAELLQWRDRRAAQINIPRRRLVDDDVLLDLARVRPQTLDHLSSFRGLGKGELKSSADHLLSVFKRIKELSHTELPSFNKNDVPNGRESRSMDVLGCFLKILAERHDIIPRHLIATDDLLKLLRGRFETSNDLVTAGVLSAGAARLVGDDLIKVLRGELSLRLEPTPDGPQAALIDKSAIS